MWKGGEGTGEEAMDRATLSELRSLSSSLLSKELLRKYVFSSEPFTNQVVVAGIQTSLRGFTNRLIDTLLYLLVLAMYIFVVCAKLATLGSPQAVKVLTAVWDFHRTKLKPSDLLVETMIIALLVAYMLHRKRISRAWTGVEKSIAAKSEAAARVAPHVLFFASAVIVTVLAGNLIRPIAAAALPVVVLVTPFVRTVLLLARPMDKEGQAPSYTHYRQFISLWVVLGMLNCTGSLLALLPLSHRLYQSTPLLRELLLVVLLWMHISPLCTDIVYEATRPLVQLLACRVPAMSLLVVQASTYDTPSINSPSGTAGALGMALQSLNFMSLLSDAQLSFLRAVTEDGVVFFLTLIFVLTPTPIALVGEYLVTWALPVFRSSSTLSGLVAVAVDSRSDYSNTPLVSAAVKKMQSLHSGGSVDSTSPGARKEDSGSKAAKKKKKISTAVIVDDSCRVQLESVQRTPHPRRGAPPPAPASTLDGSEALLVRERRRWLEYWAVIVGVAMLRRAGVLPLLPSMQMLLALYLQHSYFRGASKVIAYILQIREAVKINKKGKSVACSDEQGSGAVHSADSAAAATPARNDSRGESSLKID